MSDLREELEQEDEVDEAAVEEAASKADAAWEHMHPSSLLESNASFGDKATGVVVALSTAWASILFFVTVEVFVYPILNHFFLHFDPQLTLDTYVISVLAILLAQVILKNQGRHGRVEEVLAHNAYHQIAEIRGLVSVIHKLVQIIHRLQKQQMVMLDEIARLRADLDNQEREQTQ